MSYEAEAAALDRRILTAIELWARSRSGPAPAEFDALALELFAHQVRYNAPYAAFAAAQGYDARHLPRTWREIPAVPAAAFKEAVLATFPPERAALHFETSGTTAGSGGHHYLESEALYRASLLAGFDAFMLADGAALRYLNLVPDPRERRTSSLGYMMGAVSAERGDGQDGWFVHGDVLDSEAFLREFERARREGAALCIAGTAFAFVALLEALATRSLQLEAPAGSRIMETGGFKGRVRRVERAELYAELSARLGIPPQAIVAEYGMTELCGQYYDSLASRSRSARVKVSPPWLRAAIVDAGGRELPAGTVGALRHVDLSNRSSVIAIETEDLAFARDDGFVLLGREAAAELRGCSLDAEDLDSVSR